MIVVFPDTALVYLLEKVVSPKLTFNLYINNVSPNTDSTLASFTRANYSSYAPIDVPAAAWSFSTVLAHVGELRALEIFWVNHSPGPVTVYGYYFVDSTGTVLVGAARFDDAPKIVPVGGNVGVIPLLGSFSGLPG